MGSVLNFCPTGSNSLDARWNISDATQDDDHEQTDKEDDAQDDDLEQTDDEDDSEDDTQDDDHEQTDDVEDDDR